jgi:uncharacterized protein
MAGIAVFKLDLAGTVTWQYEGRILRQAPDEIVVEALFNGRVTPVADVVLQTGDRFVETYYTDRWYNIYEVHDGVDDRLKGWYCNISRPAVIREASVSYVDLALDLWVSADGRQIVLDREEFDALPIEPAERAAALAALAELRERFKKERPLL